MTNEQTIKQLEQKVFDLERQVRLLRFTLIKYVGMAPILESPDKDVVLSYPLKDIAMSNRVRTVLAKADIHTVGDLHEHSKRQISIIRGLGPKGIEEVDQLFKHFGIHYAEEF